MRKSDFQQLLMDQHKTLLGLTASKGEEYANDDCDQLANFKRQAGELGITAQQVLRVFLTKHLDAITHYCRTGKVLSEEVIGRIDDAILYLILLKAMRIEEIQAPVGIPVMASQVGIRPGAPYDESKFPVDVLTSAPVNIRPMAPDDHSTQSLPFLKGDPVRVALGEWAGYEGIVNSGVNDKGEYLVHLGVMFGDRPIAHSKLARRS